MEFANGPEPYVPTSGERRGSAFAHGAGLVIGIPLILLLGLYVGVPPAFAYLPSPVAAYITARKFRSSRLPWGAFQGMQATVVHLGIGLLGLAANLLGPTSRPSSFLFMLAVLLLLYSVWGAWDTLLGEDFRYAGINKLLHRVTQSNIRRQDRRRGYIRSYRKKNDQQDPQ